MASWRTYTAMSAANVADTDLLPFSDESQVAGSRTRTISVANLREALDGGLLPVRTYSGTATLDATDDLGAHVRITGAATITVPPDLPIGWWCTISNLTASDTVSLAEGSGVTILSVGDDITNGKWVAVVVSNTNVVEAVGAFADDPDLAPADLNDLDDVNTSGVGDGDSLVYDSGTSMWVPGDPPGLQAGDDAADLGSGAATDGFVLTADGAGGAAWEAVAGAGDVTGPASAVDDRIATFDGTTGKLLQDGGVTVAGLATAAQGALADSAVQPATNVVPIIVACSDETTALTTGAAKVTFRMPFAMTLTAVRASVTTAPTDAAISIGINEGGVSILSTDLTIDATEKTSTTAATAAVISDSSLADDAEITIDIDQIGSTVAGAGLKVALIGYRTV